MKQADGKGRGVRSGTWRAMVSIVLALAIVAPTTGCSWVFVKGPPSVAPPASEPLVCSSKTTAVGADVGISLVHLIFAAVWSAAGAPLLAVGNSVWALIHSLSALSGSKKVKRCIQMKQERATADGDDDAIVKPTTRPPPTFTAPGSTPTTSTTPGTPGTTGNAGGPCYGNSSCNTGLTCDPVKSMCFKPVAPGQAGGACYGNGTCNSGIACDRSSMRCKNPVAAGAVGGACYGNDTCNTGLVCAGATKTCITQAKIGEEHGRCYGNSTCNTGLTCDRATNACRK